MMMLKTYCQEEDLLLSAAVGWADRTMWVVCRYTIIISMTYRHDRVHQQ